MVTFDKMGLSPELLKGVTEAGFEKPTPVQEKAVPFLIKNRRDLIGLAQTGTGKTAAFGLPIIDDVDPSNKTPQSLVLCPTRELCLQITTEFKKFAKYKTGVSIVGVYGGAPIDAQLRALSKGAHIVVATPGRMLDIIRRKRIVLTNINRVVLDEADEMLNMGFKEDLNAILSETPAEKDTLLFSATMPKGVATIAMDYMEDPYEVTVGKKNQASENITHVYYAVQARDKYLALKRILDSEPNLYGIIFCRTRQDTKDTAESLMKDGYNVEPLHGDLSHAQRESVMKKFRVRSLQVLVATDVAARGLDVEDVTHTVNYSMPEELEIYTHRSGRTGRAGKKGTSIAIISLREEFKIKRIEKMIGQKFERLQIPPASAVFENQLTNIVKRIEDVKIDDEKVDPLVNSLFEKLGDMSEKDIVKRLLAMEFQQLFSYYEKAPDLNDPGRSSGSGREGRGGGGRSGSGSGRERFSRFSGGNRGGNRGGS
ncbi:MAG: DEAD/DEAH box helicase, partial [Leptospirales bacterium]